MITLLINLQVHMSADMEDNRYLLLIGDVFSKYVRMVALKDRTMEGVKSALLQHWFNDYPRPKFLFSDPKAKVGRSKDEEH